MIALAEQFRVQPVIFCLSAALICALYPQQICAGRMQNEAKLVASIEREKKPVKKAKLEVRLGQLQLQQAISAYEKQQIPQGQKLLASFLDDMENAWNTLKASGRNAANKPQGFRGLEIGMNQDTRRLDDLRRQVFYLYRGPIEETLSKLNQLHAQVLVALFPGSVPPPERGPGSKSQTGHFSREVRQQ